MAILARVSHHKPHGGNVGYVAKVLKTKKKIMERVKGEAE